MYTKSTVIKSFIEYKKELKTKEQDLKNLGYQLVFLDNSQPVQYFMDCEECIRVSIQYNDIGIPTIIKMPKYN